MKKLLFLIFQIFYVFSSRAQNLNIILENPSSGTMKKIYNPPSANSPKWEDFDCGVLCCDHFIVFKISTSPTTSNIVFDNVTVERRLLTSSAYTSVSCITSNESSQSPTLVSQYLDINPTYYEPGYCYKINLSVIVGGNLINKTIYLDYKKGHDVNYNYITAEPKLYVGGIQCTNNKYHYTLFGPMPSNSVAVSVPNMSVNIASSTGTFSQVFVRETNSLGVPLSGFFLFDQYLASNTVGLGLLSGLSVSQGIHYYKVTLVKGQCHISEGYAKTFFVKFNKTNTTTEQPNNNGTGGG